MLPLVFVGEICGRKEAAGTYLQVLEDEFKLPHKRQRVGMKFGRRQLKPLENPDLEIIEGQVHPCLFESKFVHGKPFARIRRAYPSISMGILEHPICRGPFCVFLRAIERICHIL